MKNYGIKEWFKAHPEQSFIPNKEEKKNFDIEKIEQEEASFKEEKKKTPIKNQQRKLNY